MKILCFGRKTLIHKAVLIFGLVALLSSCGRTLFNPPDSGIVDSRGRISRDANPAEVIWWLVWNVAENNDLSWLEKQGVSPSEFRGIRSFRFVDGTGRQLGVELLNGAMVSPYAGGSNPAIVTITKFQHRADKVLIEARLNGPQPYGDPRLHATATIDDQSNWNIIVEPGSY